MSKLLVKKISRLIVLELYKKKLKYLKNLLLLAIF